MQTFASYQKYYQSNHFRCEVGPVLWELFTNSVYSIRESCGSISGPTSAFDGVLKKNTCWKVL